MPTTISNSFSSVRSAFNTEGYGNGVSNSFLAYRQGGGIVPFTPPFNSIGAATPGDDLRLSQFNGFTVPGVIASLSNHSASAFHTVSNPVGASPSASASLIVNPNGELTMQGGTGWGSTWSSFGSSIIIDGVEYWSSTFAGSNSGQILVQRWANDDRPSLYSCRGTIETGSSTPDGFNTIREGTYGSWLNLASSQQFRVIASSGSASVYNAITLIMTLQFARSNNTSNILGSCTITLGASAEYTAGGGGGGILD